MRCGYEDILGSLLFYRDLNHPNCGMFEYRVLPVVQVRVVGSWYMFLWTDSLFRG